MPSRSSQMPILEPMDFGLRTPADVLQWCVGVGEECGEGGSERDVDNECRYLKKLFAIQERRRTADVHLANLASQQLASPPESAASATSPRAKLAPHAAFKVVTFATKLKKKVSRSRHAAAANDDVARLAHCYYSAAISRRVVKKHEDREARDADARLQMARSRLFDREMVPSATLSLAAQKSLRIDRSVMRQQEDDPLSVVCDVAVVSTFAPRRTSEDGPLCDGSAATAPPTPASSKAKNACVSFDTVESPLTKVSRVDSMSIAAQLPLSMRYEVFCEQMSLKPIRSVVKILETEGKHHAQLPVGGSGAEVLPHVMSLDSNDVQEEGAAGVSDPKFAPWGEGSTGNKHSEEGGQHEAPLFEIVANRLMSVAVGAPIEMLDFSSIYLGPRGVFPVLELLNWLPSLVFLSFAGCGIGFEAVQGFTTIATMKLPNLMFIDLSDNPKIGFAGGIALQRYVSRSPNVQCLVLKGTGVKASTLRSIEAHIERHNASKGRMASVSFANMSAAASQTGQSLFRVLKTLNTSTTKV